MSKLSTTKATSHVLNFDDKDQMNSLSYYVPENKGMTIKEVEELFKKFEKLK